MNTVADAKRWLSGKDDNMPVSGTLRVGSSTVTYANEGDTFPIEALEKVLDRLKAIKGLARAVRTGRDEGRRP